MDFNIGNFGIVSCPTSDRTIFRDSRTMGRNSLLCLTKSNHSNFIDFEGTLILKPKPDCYHTCENHIEWETVIHVINLAKLVFDIYSACLVFAIV